MHDFLCRIAPGKPTTFGDCVYCSLMTRWMRNAYVAAIEALGGER